MRTIYFIVCTCIHAEHNYVDQVHAKKRNKLQFLTTEVGHESFADVECIFLGQSGCCAVRGTPIDLSLYSIHLVLIKRLAMHLTYVV